MRRTAFISGEFNFDPADIVNGPIIFSSDGTDRIEGWVVSAEFGTEISVDDDGFRTEQSGIKLVLEIE